MSISLYNVYHTALNDSCSGSAIDVVDPSRDLDVLGDETGRSKELDVVFDTIGDTAADGEEVDHVSRFDFPNGFDAQILKDGSMHSFVGETVHSAFGMLDYGDLSSAEKLLRNNDTSESVCSGATGIADNVGLADADSKSSVGIDSGVHAGDKYEVPRWGGLQPSRFERARVAL